jgi:hypothetical protein
MEVVKTNRNASDNLERNTDNLIAYTASPLPSTTTNKKPVFINKGGAEYRVGKCNLFGCD